MQVISISEAAKRYDIPISAFERSVKNGNLPAIRVRGEYYTLVEVFGDKTKEERA